MESCIAATYATHVRSARKNEEGPIYKGRLAVCLLATGLVLSVAGPVQAEELPVTGTFTGRHSFAFIEPPCSFIHEVVALDADLDTLGAARIATSATTKASPSVTKVSASVLSCTTRRFYASWLNRIEAQFTALRYFALEGTDHPSHQAQARMIRRYIAWLNRNAHEPGLRELVNRANVA